MRPRAVGHPEKYPQFAAKPCPACLEERRGQVILMPWFVRRADHDEAFISYQCPRCAYVDDFVAPVELALISHPSGRIFGHAPTGT